MSSLQRLTCRAALAVSLLLLPARPSNALDVKWDPTHQGAGGGGPGAWDGSAQWYNGSNDVTLGATDGAVFANTGGAVTVTGTQNVGNMTFTGSGYTFSGGTINMAGGFGFFGNQSATINSTLTSSGKITVDGSYAGTLVLGGTDNVQGFQVNGGTAEITGSFTTSNGRFYVGNGSDDGGNPSNNGTLRIDNGATFTVASAGDAVIGRDGGTWNRQSGWRNRKHQSLPGNLSQWHGNLQLERRLAQHEQQRSGRRRLGRDRHARDLQWRTSDQHQ